MSLLPMTRREKIEQLLFAAHNELIELEVNEKYLTTINKVRTNSELSRQIATLQSNKRQKASYIQFLTAEAKVEEGNKKPNETAATG